MRLIDADALLIVCKKAYKFSDNRGKLGHCIAAIEDAPVVDAIPREKWNELKETIIEMCDNGCTASPMDICKFLTNLMEIFEKEGKNDGSD